MLDLYEVLAELVVVVFIFLVALFESEVLDVVGNEGDNVVSGECGIFSVIFSKSYASIVHMCI